MSTGRTARPGRVRARVLLPAIFGVALATLIAVPQGPLSRFVVTAGGLPSTAQPGANRTARAGVVPPVTAPSVSEGRPPRNIRVTKDDVPGSYLRADGAVDETMRRCSTGRREQNEPSVAVDPRHPNIVAMGANDYCAAITTGDAWVGFYRSTDGGRTWVDGLVPGYPTDTSFAGRASAAHGRCIAGSDPTLAFDRAGRLFFGFVCFGRLEGGRRGVVGSSTLIATYDHDGSRYVRTILVSRGTPDRNEDKINLTVDQSRGRYGGNVYAAWVQLAKPTKQGYPQDPLLFARSTDHGATFSRPAPVSALVHSRFPDMAVGPDATVYVGFRSGDTLWVASSTNGGRSFRNPVQVAGTIVPFDSGQFTAGSPRDDCGVGRYRCHSHLIFSRFDTQIVVCADEAGVHVAWNERVGEGQSKVMIRNSRDGVTWSPAQQIDHIGAGHQYFPDITSGGGVITLVFYDSRNDPAYAPTLPPGDTAAGKSSGGAVDVYAAQSLDGGLAWTERRVTNHSSNLNFMTPSSVPFWGDYIYVSAAGRHVQVAWTDSRDFVTRKKGSFLPYRPCGSRQYVNDPCVSEGGSDENVYTARL